MTAQRGSKYLRFGIKDQGLAECPAKDDERDAIAVLNCIIPRSKVSQQARTASCPMNHRPNLLSLTTMHEAGLRILKEATDLRMASSI